MHSVEPHCSNSCPNTCLLRYTFTWNHLDLPSLPLLTLPSLLVITPHIYLCTVLTTPVQLGWVHMCHPAFLALVYTCLPCGCLGRAPPTAVIDIYAPTVCLYTIFFAAYIAPSLASTLRRRLLFAACAVYARLACNAVLFSRARALSSPSAPLNTCSCWLTLRGHALHARR